MTAKQRKQNRLKRGYNYSMERLGISKCKTNRHEFSFVIFTEGVEFGEGLAQAKVDAYRKRLTNFIKRSGYADKALELAALEAE